MFISVKDNDLNSVLQNPSLLTPAMEKQLALSAVSFYDKVKFGEAAYAYKAGKFGTLYSAMHFVHYGEFVETNEAGETMGTFRAADYALLTGYAHALNPRISIGGNLKFIYSDYYLYHAFGMAVDIGATYYDSANQITVSVVGRNIGGQLKSYTGDHTEPLPAEVMAAVSKRLAHVPFRLNLTARHLEKFDMTYVDPNDPDNFDPITGEQNIDEASFGEKLARHFIVGGEFLFSQNFHFRVAYNFQRRREMIVETARGTVGFSWGFGLRVSKFHISYGRAAYHAAGGSNHFSVTTNLGEFYTRKNGKNP